MRMKSPICSAYFLFIANPFSLHFPEVYLHPHFYSRLELVVLQGGVEWNTLCSGTLLDTPSIRPRGLTTDGLTLVYINSLLVVLRHSQYGKYVKGISHTGMQPHRFRIHMSNVRVALMQEVHCLH